MSSQDKGMDIGKCDDYSSPLHEHIEARVPKTELTEEKLQRRDPASASGEHFHTPRAKPYSRPPKTTDTHGASQDAN